jgi:hypothetical protein
MEVIDKRRLDEEGNAKTFHVEQSFDTFKPTLKGCRPKADLVLVRVLNLPDDNLIATPDAFAEPTQYGEVQACMEPEVPGVIVKFLKDVGTSMEFVDGRPGAKYRMLHQDDIICRWPLEP